MDKLLGDTTVVTESRTYLVDRLGKKSAKRAMVSAKSSSISQLDVEVTRTKPHTITRNSNKFLQIATAFPVIAHFIPGPPDEEYPEEPGTTYTTGVIYAESEANVNAHLQIAVYDPDVVKDKLQVTVFNATTGETEYLTLDKIADSMYRSTIYIELKPIRGEDFDGIMHASPDDVLRVIYQDGRGSSGEPVNVVKNITVVSAFQMPVLEVRRACPPNGRLGIALFAENNGSTPFVTLTLQRTGERLVSHLMPADGGHWAHSVDMSQHLIDTQDGDTLTAEYAFDDMYGSLQTITKQIQITQQPTLGVLTVPANVQPTLEAVFRVDDPDVLTEYVDLVIAGKQTNKFVRVRANRVGLNTGIYEARYTLGSIFDQDTVLTVTYADSNVGGAPTIIRKETPILRSGPVQPEQPETPSEPETDVVQQIALQLEINGLFTLNGKFSGIVKLYAKEDETVRCSILQAS